MIQQIVRIGVAIEFIGEIRERAAALRLGMGLEARDDIDDFARLIGFREAALETRLMLGEACLLYTSDAADD